MRTDIKIKKFTKWFWMALNWNWNKQQALRRYELNVYFISITNIWIWESIVESGCRSFLTKNKASVWFGAVFGDLSKYVLDNAPSEYFLFLKLKIMLPGKIIASNLEVISKTEALLKQRMVQKWYQKIGRSRRLSKENNEFCQKNLINYSRPWTFQFSC